MNTTYERNFYHSFFFTIGNLAQFDDCFCSSILSLNSATRNITSHLLSYTTHTHQIQWIKYEKIQQ
jgi:hypothetical protein